ncbi:unnamed protein product [Merluccius merluccius]
MRTSAAPGRGPLTPSETASARGAPNNNDQSQDVCVIGFKLTHPAALSSSLPGQGREATAHQCLVPRAARHPLGGGGAATAAAGHMRPAQGRRHHSHHSLRSNKTVGGWSEPRCFLSARHGGAGRRQQMFAHSLLAVVKMVKYVKLHVGEEETETAEMLC